jgi:hypothetical protein
MNKLKLILICSIIYSLVTFFLTIALMSYHSNSELDKVQDSKRMFNILKENVVNDNDSQIAKLDLYQECNYLPETKSKLRKQLIIFTKSQIILFFLQR